MKKTLFTVVVLSLAGLSGCASTESIPVNAQNGNVEVMDDAALAIQKVKVIAEKVELQYQSAKDQNYIYFAPDSWKDINSRVRTMRTLVQQFDPNNQGFFGGPSEDKVLDKIEDAQQALDRAARIKILVSEYLVQQLADIAYLSPQVRGEWQYELTKIDESVADLIADIEDDDSTSGYEKQSEKIQTRLFDLEIRIVKNKYHTPLITKMKKLDKKLIPVTHAQVQQSLQKLSDAITLAPREQDVIETIVARVEDDLRRANNVTAEVNWIKSIDSSESEKIALRYRDAVATAAFNLFSEDISSLTYTAQVAYFENAMQNNLNHQQVINDEQAQLIMSLTEQLKTALQDLDENAVDVYSSLQVPSETEPNNKLEN